MGRKPLIFQPFIGAMILRFSSMDEMLGKMDHMQHWVKVRTRQI